jgi:hypothetical protein
MVENLAEAYGLDRPARDEVEKAIEKWYRRSTTD